LEENDELYTPIEELRKVYGSRITWRASKKSRYNEFLFRKQQFDAIVRNFLSKYVDFNGKSVLDVGCGYGPASDLLSKVSRDVVAVDVSVSSLNEAHRFCKNAEISFVGNNAENLAFEDECFDIVIAFGVLEHVKNPESAVREFARVVKRGGYIIVDFNPYYSLPGHHLYDYTILPVQFLPEKFVVRYILNKKPSILKTKSFAKKEDEIKHKLYCLEVYRALNKLTVSRFYDIERKVKLRVIEERFIIRIPDIFEVNLSLLKYMGPLKESAFSYQALLRKSL